MSRLLLSISISLMAIISLMTAEAHAYTLYKTDNGTPVRWHRSEVVVLLDPSLAVLGPMDAVASSLKQAFHLWRDQADIPVDFILKEQHCAASRSERDNCIMANADTHHDGHGGDKEQGDEKKGATTLLEVLPSSGEIQSADIVFNAAQWHWDCASASPEALNLARVSAHEVGHFLGIDHSEQPDALMYPSMSQYDRTAPQLHEDDMLAATNLYDGFTQEDITQEEVTTSDCSVTSVGLSPSASLVFLIFCAAMLIWRNRRALN